VQRRQLVTASDTTRTYRKLVAILVSHAVRMGSTDAEGAAQEALRRSFAHSLSREALEYYLPDDPGRSAAEPVWTFGQLLAWLHGVLRRVVLEEHAHAKRRREVPAVDVDTIAPVDPSPGQLDVLIDDQVQSIVRECFSSLSEDYRRVLSLRAEGLKYTEIAARLGVSDNTVATWVSGATKAIAMRVRERLAAVPRGAMPPEFQG
jgi:RNA polymerase sigma factor (sigma-70 family)